MVLEGGGFIPPALNWRVVGTRKNVANGESWVSAYLNTNGLRVERFDKAAMQMGRTPDFRVFVENRLAFYCEVKTAQEDEWLDLELAKVPRGKLAGGARPDPTYNRISNHIHSAAGQFDAVNPRCEYPNVLALVNNDSQAGTPDLLAVLTGNAYTEAGAIPMFTNFSEDRICEEKERIHLYLWFDVGERQPRKFWTQSNPEHHAALCRCLGIDPTLINQI